MAVALFYERSIEATQLRQYARGLFEPPAVDVIEFTQPEGGVIARELAIPYLAGMDAVRVAQARLQVRARGREMDAQFSVHPAGAPGVVIALPRTARLSKIGLAFSVPPAALPPGQTTPRIVVRSAVKEGSGFTIGPPLFADPGFAAPGPMFPSPLAGMRVTRSATGAVLNLPMLLGDAWFVQLATGDDAVKLTPLDVTPDVQFVKIDAVPRDLSVTLKRASEAPQIWSYPNLFLPEAGIQELDFSPLAQKQLSDALANVSSGTTATLPLALEFSSSAGGDLAVSSRTLDARYTVDGAGPQGCELEVGGALTELRLSAPAGLRPVQASVDLTISLHGRELNAASPEPPVASPSSGVRIQKQVTAAAPVLFVARDPQAPATSPLVAVRVYLLSESAAEAVLELRADAAGLPGALVVPAIVRQVVKGSCGWCEFQLPAPFAAAAAETRLWVTLRTNSGDLFWFTDPGGQAAAGRVVISQDSGATWGSPRTPLGEYDSVLVQLFNAVPDPQPEPSIRVQQGPVVLAADLLQAGTARPSPTGPREFSWRASDLPAAVTSLLAKQPGSGKVQTSVQLFSRAVATVQVTRFVLEYDPFQASAVR